MARPRLIDEDDLIAGLARVFSDVGYEGASLTMLSTATGLQRASLYHRFPGGKQQMAAEVLTEVEVWLSENVLAVLKGQGSPGERLAQVAGNLDRFYQGGRQPCLLNMLSSAKIADGPFAPAIRAAFAALIAGLAALAGEAGLPEPVARHRAERAVMLLQGSLVMARGMGTTAPFQAFLQALPDDLLSTP